MPNVGPIDRALRTALGQGVRPIAEHYDVYRINSASTGQLISPNNKVISNYPARIIKNVPKALMEQRALYPMLYAGFCNTNLLRMNDILVQTGPPLTDTPDGRIFVLCSVQPLMAPVFARTEVLGALSQPHSISQLSEPLLGDGGVASTTKNTEWLVTLSVDCSPQHRRARRQLYLWGSNYVNAAAVHKKLSILQPPHAASTTFTSRQCRATKCAPMTSSPTPSVIAIASSFPNTTPQDFKDGPDDA